MKKEIKEKKVDLSIIKKMCALCSTSAEYLQYAEVHLINGFENNFYSENKYHLQDRKQRRILDKKLEMKINQLKKQSQEQVNRLLMLEENFKEAMRDTDGEMIENYITSIHNSLDGLETRSELTKVYGRFTILQEKQKRKNKITSDLLNELSKILK
tara:strand:- start:20 stop:487 length:468 start_codon:yes stop_codon:yes gene_type:complete